VVAQPARLPRASQVEVLHAPEGGWLAAIDARAIGLATVALGAGREKKGDRIDLAVGMVLHAKVGDRVEPGQPLIEIHANDRGRLEQARALVRAAYRFSSEPTAPPALIHHVITP
jgi:thymidine phosphorylase